MTAKAKECPPLLEGERIEDLNRAGLRIIQNSKAPCFSLDALLLADFALKALDKPGHTSLKLGDFGSGTGILALLTAWALPQSQIAALELMPAMAEMSRRSVILNGLEGRIRILEGDIRRAAEYWPRASFDGILSNPPYMEESRGRISPHPLFAAAKSEQFCRLEQLIAAAAPLLKPGGSIFLSQRPRRLAEALHWLAAYGLCPVRLCLVHPFAHKEAGHFLLQGIRRKNQELKILPPLVIYAAPGQYTREAAEILAEPLKGHGAELNVCTTDSD